MTAGSTEKDLVLTTIIRSITMTRKVSIIGENFTGGTIMNGKRTAMLKIIQNILSNRRIIRLKTGNPR